MSYYDEAVMMAYRLGRWSEPVGTAPRPEPARPPRREAEEAPVRKRLAARWAGRVLHAAGA